MKIVKVNVNLGGKLSANYNSVSVDVGAEALVEEGEDFKEIIENTKKELNELLAKGLNEQVDGLLNE